MVKGWPKFLRFYELSSNLDLLKTFFKELFQECFKKNIFILASSTSFFFILCLIPTTLLLLNYLHLFVSEYIPDSSFSFLTYIESIVPESIMPSFLKLFNHAKTIIDKNQENSFLNYMILLISSMSFFGSIWKSVEIITEDRRNTLMRTLQSFLTIALFFSFVLVILLFPILLESLTVFFRLKFFEDFDLSIINFFKTVDNFSGIYFINIVLLFIFFFVFFKFLLKRNADNFSAIGGSLTFTILSSILNTVFVYYIKIIGTNLQNSYGSLYSFLLFALWFYSNILIFYFSIVSTHHLFIFKKMRV